VYAFLVEEDKRFSALLEGEKASQLRIRAEEEAIQIEKEKRAFDKLEV
jgi:hypothetical protein